MEEGVIHKFVGCRRGYFGRGESNLKKYVKSDGKGICDGKQAGQRKGAHQLQQHNITRERTRNTHAMLLMRAFDETETRQEGHRQNQKSQLDLMLHNNTQLKIVPLQLLIMNL